MPRLEPIRTLTLVRAPAPGMPQFLSAASGLVSAGGHWYVIGDDLHHLGVFPTNGRARGSLVRLFPGTIATDAKKRKKRKPDFETLVLLPPFAEHPQGALLALGSGSRTRRQIGALIALDGHRGVVGSPMLVDLSQLYAPLEREFGELNIEGAFIDGKHLALLQRGHAQAPRNARVRVRMAPLVAALADGVPLPARAVHDITDYALPAVDGVPLCFTDGAALRDGGFVFTAVAENTGNSYDDGGCVGSAIGIIGPDDGLTACWRLAPPLKVEGIAVREHAQRLDVHVVTDADNPRTPARLLSATLPRPR
jgi:hypothetical protein